MRKIRGLEIFTFMTILSIVVILALFTDRILLGWLPPGDFRGIILFLAGVLLIYCYAFLAYRMFLRIYPLKEGEILADSREEFGYHVYLLFYLILFYPVLRSGSVPVPMMRLIYQILGAKLGDNTYSSGIILDPPLIEIGSNSIVGKFALLVPHVIEGHKLAHYKITIGNNVTVGAHAVVLAGVTIGDNAIIAMGAIVPKGSRVDANTVWGGVPAKLLRGPDA
jgi:acetyltransferase-like isoleucine patch superfamily enzyme